MFDIFFENPNHTVDCNKYDELDTSYTEAIESLYINSLENVLMIWNNHTIILPIYSCISALFSQIKDLIIFLSSTQYDKNHAKNNIYKFSLLSSELTVNWIMQLMPNNKIAIQPEWLSVRIRDNCVDGSFYDGICIDKDDFMEKWILIINKIEKILYDCGYKDLV